MVDVDPNRLSRIVNRSAEGGVNNKLFALDINADQAEKLQNIDTSVPGQRRRRPSTSLTATGIPFGPIKGLGILPLGAQSVPTNVKLLAVAPGTTSGGVAEDVLFEWEGTGLWVTVGILTGHTSADSYIVRSGIDISGGGFDPRRAIFMPNKIQGTNTDVFFYDGSNLSTCHYGSANNPPRHGGFDIFSGRGFGLSGTPQEVIFSSIGAFTHTQGFDPASEFIFSSDRAQGIQAISGFRQNEVLVYMSDSLEELVIINQPSTFNENELVSPLGSWAKRTISKTYGTESPHAIATAGQDQLFVDQHGHVRSVARTEQDTQAGVNSLPISDAIQGTVDRVNKSNLKNAAGIAFDRFYYVSLPVGSDVDPTEIWRFDATRGAWDGPWTGDNAKFFLQGTLINESADSKLLNPTIFFSTSATFGEIRFFEGPDVIPGDPIVYQEVTRRIDFGDFYRPKAWYRLEVVGVASGEATLGIFADVDGTGTQLVGHLGLLGGVPRLPQEFPFGLGGIGVITGKYSLEHFDRGRDIQVTMTCTTSEQVRILGYSIWAHVLNEDHEVLEGS